MTDIDHAVVAIAAARVGARVRVEWVATNKPPNGIFWVTISNEWFDLTCLQAANLYNIMVRERAYDYNIDSPVLLEFSDKAYRRIRVRIALSNL